MYMNLV